MAFTTHKYDHDGRHLVIDTVHDQVHRGHLFQVDHDTGDVANATEVDLLLQVGSRHPHLVFGGDSTGAFLIELYEGTTFSAIGSSKNVYNKQRGSSKTSSVTVTSGPTLDDDGTKIGIRMIGGGKRVGGAIELSRGAEWNLNPDTGYLVRATNISGQSARVVIALDWYEPDITEP